MTAANRATPEVAEASPLLAALQATGVMAILRYRDGGDVGAAMQSLFAGRIRVLEVTVDTPGGLDALAAYRDEPGLLLGAGTVTEVEQVRRVAEVGGRFVVSPGFNPAVVAEAQSLGLEPLPGVLTATEVLTARQAGVSVLKLFPAGAFGPRYLAELRGPFGDQPFVPTGGIAIAEVPDWLAAGAVAVALGSDLAGRHTPTNAAERAELTRRAEQAIAAGSRR